MDIFVAKLDPTGQNLVWSTRIGGPNYERAYALEVDAQGFVYLAGRAGAGAPLTNGVFQATFQGGSGAAFYGHQDGYVLKLTPDGSALVWASYFGADDALSSTIIRDIALDADNNVYLAASVGSGAHYPPGVSAAFQNTAIGADDNVIAKVAANGASLLWARYLGGTAVEEGVPSIRVNGAGNIVYLTSTSSADAPTTTDAYSATKSGGIDFYVSAFSPTGSLLFATFLGGSGDELQETHQLAIGPNDTVYVAAGSLSADYPTTLGAHDRTHNGNGAAGTGANTNYAGDVVVSVLSADGKKLLASTYVGGQQGESAEGIAVDAVGNAYLTGGTFSNDFPVTARAYQTARKGVLDAFFVKLPPDLSQLTYATFLGGSGSQAGRGACVDTSGNFFMVGEVGGTAADTLPTLNAFQSTYGGATDSFFVRFGPTADTLAPASPTQLHVQ